MEELNTMEKPNSLSLERANEKFDSEGFKDEIDSLYSMVIKKAKAGQHFSDEERKVYCDKLLAIVDRYALETEGGLGIPKVVNGEVNIIQSERIKATLEDFLSNPSEFLDGGHTVRSLPSNIKNGTHDFLLAIANYAVE